jgi:hypothetical protein
MRKCPKTGHLFYNGRPEYKLLFDTLMQQEGELGFKTIKRESVSGSLENGKFGGNHDV